jgi:hypothetical protein
MVEQIEARARTGRPLASPERIAEAEAAMDRKLGPQKRGPKAKEGGLVVIGIVSPEFMLAILLR